MNRGGLLLGLLAPLACAGVVAAAAFCVSATGVGLTADPSVIESTAPVVIPSPEAMASALLFACAVAIFNACCRLG